MSYEHRTIYAKDPYNPQNMVKAQVDTYYPKGHTFVTFKEINGEPVDHPPIGGTPMIQHPLHVQGYDLTNSDQAWIYTKYDGINVYAYQYEFQGEVFTTYRSRFHPFFEGSTSLKILWDAVLESQPRIGRIFDLHTDQINGTKYEGFAFEMFGSDIPRLTEYDVELHAVLIFGKKKNGEILHPTQMLNTSDIYKAEYRGRVAGDDLHHRYGNWQDSMQKRLHKTNTDKLRPKYTGDIGTIWYATDKPSGQTIMLKCEPPELEELPSVLDTALSYNSIRSAILKAGENFASPNTDNILVVLRENYNNKQIQASFDKIVEVVENRNDEIELNYRILTEMTRHGFDSETEVPTIIRAIREKFEKHEMKDVYHAIRVLQKYRDPQVAEIANND